MNRIRSLYRRCLSGDSLALLSLLSFFVFLFILLKSVFASFTHDESYSFIQYIAASYQAIWNFEPLTANNHLLNSLVTRFIYRILGSDEWILRLPNVLAGLGFILLAFRISKHFMPLPALRFACWSLLVLNPYLLDFFALSRGYGLSAFFLLVALYQGLWLVREPERMVRTWMLNLALLLAISANLNTVTPALAIVLSTLFLFLLERNGKAVWHTLIGSAVVALLLFTVFHEPVQQLREAGELYYGTTSLFDTWNRLALNAFYTLPGHVQWPSLRFVVAGTIALLGLLLLVRVVIRKQVRINLQLVFLVCCTAALIIGHVLEHHLLDLLYPVNRTSTYYYVFLALVLSFSIKALSAHLENTGSWIARVLVVLLGINFLSGLDGRAYREWRYDKHTKAIVYRLNEQAPEQERGTHLGIHWTFEPTINYYIKSRNFWKLKHVHRDGTSATDHYFYVYRNDLPELDADVTVLEEYSDIETVLLKNNAYAP